MTDTNTPALPAWLLSADDMKALIRFAECAEDWDTDEHDVSKEAMKRLERLGAVRSLGFGRHETTAFGDAMLAAAPEVPQVDSQAMQADELQANVYLDRDEIAGLRVQNDQLLAACRKAVLALGHAAERRPVYRRDYDALSTAIDAARDQQKNPAAP